MITLTEENYIKGIYKISLDPNQKITPTAIAEEIRVNAASVIDMLKKLKEKKLISYDKVKGAKLTTSGYKLALNIVRKHRLWEVFLYEKLKFTWDEIHEMAEQLEHIQNDDLAERLDEYLGFPEYDPHGDPIPKADGRIATAPRTLLSEITDMASCEIVSVKDTSTEFLRYLRQLHIEIGTKLKIVDFISFDNSLLLSVAQKEITVSQKFAENIYVKKIS